MVVNGNSRMLSAPATPRLLFWAICFLEIQSGTFFYHSGAWRIFRKSVTVVLFAHGWCLALVLLGHVDALQWREEKHPTPEPSLLTRTCARTFLMFSRLLLSMLDAA